MRVLLCVVLGLTIAACRVVGADADGARLVSPTAAAIAELRDAISEALGGVDVAVPPDAFMTSSLLVLERMAHRDAAGRRIQGRELGMPEQFRLAKSNGDCVLSHVRSGRRWRLTEVRCVAE
jgi:hypothetical protein